MARAVSSRAASAKAVETKAVNVNGTARRAKIEAAPVTNGHVGEMVLDSEPPVAKSAKGRANKSVVRDPTPKVTLPQRTKRKKDDEPSKDAEMSEEPSPEPISKKARVTQTKPASKTVSRAAAKAAPKGPRRLHGKKTEINAIRYTKALKVFVFGDGANGELGLGATKKAIDVKRPRFNEALSSQEIVRVAAGGMHVLALTKDNKILSWGVNDSGALGRDTSHADVPMRDQDADDDSDSDDETGGLIDLEATPAAIPAEHFPEDTVFVDIAAGDSCSFALTTEGAVYGWGTFRKNEGILGFGHGDVTAKTPQYVEGLTKATDIACGTNHIFALTKDGNVYAWGSGQQNQLGRRVTERNLAEGLFPSKLGFRDSSFKRPSHKIVSIASGDYHGLAIAEDGHVWAWGVNNYCETGYPANAGADDAQVIAPRIVASLEGKDVTSIAAGSHHNLAITKSGQVLTWGRCDGSQTGLSRAFLDGINDPERLLLNNNKPKILLEPTPISSLNKIVAAACGPDHNIVIDENGKAHSWGFSANYQTGQGTTDDIDIPTMIDNTAVRETKLTWAGCGGQYSVLASEK